ncbi:transcriptional repressor [Clostridiaceae bacterium]|nr:transcriptional repressor [Clostridiaceae bacterium]RKI08441.1 transcriptional repressor [bacterium 1XD21-70]
MGRYAELILGMIQESRNHMTAEEIFLQLKKKEPRVVLATVYNNLNLLCREEKIRRISVEGVADRFDKVKKHDHLMCRKCGKLSDICFADLTGELEGQLGEGILSYDLKVFYICPDCRKHQGAHKPEDKD